MKKNYKYAVFIGRFQPYHVAHHETVLAGLDRAENLIIAIGSVNSPRTIKNPWTAPEREAMIRASLTEAQNKRVHFIYAEDRLYQDHEWVRNLLHKVSLITGAPFKDREIAIIAHSKDDSTYYLNYFKVWDYLPIDCKYAGCNTNKPLSSTKLRELMFEGYLGMIESVVPKGVYNALVEYCNDPNSSFNLLCEEYKDAVAYEKQFEGFPYGVNFLTTDAVVVQSGHVLLVKRKHAPGKGLWALPGGHVNQNEKIFDACIRELYEETKIKVPEKVLKGSVYYEKIFDHPDRSLRARILKKKARSVTVAFGFKLDDKIDLPKVSASSDAADVWWFTLDEIDKMRDQIFEDHKDLIEFMIARIPV